MSYDLNILGAALEETPLLQFDQTVCEGRVKALQRALLLLLRDNQGDSSRLGTEFSSSLVGVSTANPDTLTNSLALIQDQLLYSVRTAQEGEELDDDEIISDVQLVHDGVDPTSGQAIVVLTVTTQAGDSVATRIPQTYKAD